MPGFFGKIGWPFKVKGHNIASRQCASRLKPFVTDELAVEGHWGGSSRVRWIFIREANTVKWTTGS